MNFESIDIKYLKLTICLLLTLTIVLCAYDNKQIVLEALGKNNSETLPIYSVETDKKVVSITFDAAWGDEDLDTILKILDNHNCKATFFVTGDWALKYPTSIKKIVNSGHDLGNHGANHKHMTTISNNNKLKEICDCHAIISSICGEEMSLFRAPFGDYDDDVILAADANNYQTIQWDVDSLDWKDYGVDSIVKTVSEHNNLKNGSIILLHNGTKYTALALDELLTTLEKKGYSFTPISLMIYKKNFYINNQGRQIPTKASD